MATDGKAKNASGDFVMVAEDGGGLEARLPATYEFVDVNQHAPVFAPPRPQVVELKEVSRDGLLYSVLTLCGVFCLLRAKKRRKIIFNLLSKIVCFKVSSFFFYMCS